MPLTMKKGKAPKYPFVLDWKSGWKDSFTTRKGPGFPKGKKGKK